MAFNKQYENAWAIPPSRGMVHPYSGEGRFMAEHGLIVWLIIGAVAGWVAGLMVRGAGFGLFIDILIGALGACLGGWLAHLAGLSVGGGFVVSLVVATLGAVVLLSALRVFKYWMR